MQEIGMLLAPSRIMCIHDDTYSRKRLLRELSNLLVLDTKLQATEVFSALFARERLGSTSIGNGVAIPHARLDKNIDKPIGAFIQISSGLTDFCPNATQPIDLFFALAVPEDSTDEYLNILSKLAQMFSDKIFCDQIRSTKDCQTLYHLFTNWQSGTIVV